MQIHTFLFLLHSMVTAQGNLIGSQPCSQINADFIAEQFDADKFVPSNEIIKDFSAGTLKAAQICSVRDERIMDGLGFILYKLEDEPNNYISVYNGLDGSSKLYGPFKL